MSETLTDDRPAPGPDDGEPAADDTTFDTPLTDDPSGDDGGDGGDGVDRGRLASAWHRLIGMPVEGWISLVVVGTCVWFVFYHLGPSNVLADNTPAGGDMGAHVWGPAYLRDHLLPSGRLTGWTPDWYAGFPAFTFYMILPSLAIAILSYLLPYGIAFKLVAVSGVCALPIAAWAFGRLSRLPFPTAPLLAVGATAFLFDRSFSIYGGNIASTLAGEFAFSISLAFAVLYLGVLGRSFESGKYRAWAAVLLALTALCHLIPFFFALAGTIVWFALQLDWGRVRLWMWGVIIALSFGLAYAAGDSILPTDQHRWPIYAPAAVYFLALVGLVAVGLTVLDLIATRARWKIAVPVLAVGGLLTAFWIVPFYLRHGLMNDMGWEKKTNYANYLFSRTTLDPQLSNRPGIEYLLVLAAMGALLALVYRRRGGLFWLAMGAIFAVAFLYMPQGRLWNARLLPFYYLSIYLLGAVGVAEIGRTLGRIVSRDVRRPVRPVLWATAAIGLIAWLIILGLPLHSLPGGGFAKDGKTWTWGPLSTTDSSFISGWAKWNFSGYEGKPAYPEYYGIMQTMGQLGQDNGCGRAMWEHEEQHDRYGTPMALMLLPFWTDGCIGSMEGLYFEASATTPYHFLNQDELSTAPSNAQRDLPYGPGAPNRDEFNLGVQHLQMLGVRYYMAISTGMIDLARTNTDLTEVASSGPWVVFQVADSELVTPLVNEPAVVNGASAGGKTWLADTVDWYMSSAQFDVPLAADGPAEWQRIQPGELPQPRPVGTTEVSNTKSGTDTISFDVSEVGVPVVVKSSYFPNWQVSGAKGPYRISPNLMVVIPTSNHVSLHYGYTPVEYFAYGLTLLGLAGLFWLWRSRPVDIPEPPPVWRQADEWDADDSDDPRDVGWWTDPNDHWEPYDPDADAHDAADADGADADGTGPHGADPHPYEPMFADLDASVAGADPTSGPGADGGPGHAPGFVLDVDLDPDIAPGPDAGADPGPGPASGSGAPER
jgi:hypothetical protein